jgi:uncharacterized Zn finger protein
MEEKAKVVIPGLSADELLHMVDNSVYGRAMNYYQHGAVREVVQSKYKLIALVDGNQYEPYQVHIKFDEAGIKNSYCDCPYDGGRYCKHIISVLLLCLHAPEKVQKITSLTDRLQRLTNTQLCSLIESLTESDVSLHRKVTMRIDSMIDTIDIRIESTKSNQQQACVDPQFYREEVYRILHSLHYHPSSRAYQHETRVLKELDEIIDEAKVFINKNDGNNALLILQALTEVCVAEWTTTLDGPDSENSRLFYDLNRAWAEAILTANLSTSETTKLRKRLQSWQSEMEDGGVDNSFTTSQLALQQGWHDPELKRVLQGEQKSPENGKKSRHDPVRRELARIRLTILERQKRYQEYIHLARQEGLSMQVIRMLIQQNQFTDAIALARIELTLSEDALTVAMKLRDHHYLADAISIAELGLRLKGHKLRIGAWLYDLAKTTGNYPLARQALMVAFDENICTKYYEHILELTPSEEMEATKSQLLSRLRRRDHDSSAAEKANIFLKEELFDEAINIVNKEHCYNDDIKHVMNSVIHHNPEWVARQARKRAMNIIDRNQASDYDEAVSWLTFVKKSHEATGNMEKWQSYLTNIKRKHKPKYKLMGLLRSEFGE